MWELGFFRYGSCSTAAGQSRTKSGCQTSLRTVLEGLCKTQICRMLALLFFQLGTPVVPFSPFYLGVSLLKLNSRKQGTLMIMRLLGNLASFVYQKGGRGKLLRSVPLSRLTKTTSAEGEGSCAFAGPLPKWVDVKTMVPFRDPYCNTAPNPKP